MRGLQPKVAAEVQEHRQQHSNVAHAAYHWQRYSQPVNVPSLQWYLCMYVDFTYRPYPH
jgi:hypothetical protein